MTQPFILFVLLSCLALPMQAQDRVWVFLRDKAGCEFDPYVYFDEKAIERRIREGLTLSDSTDFPLNDQYVQWIGQSVDSVCGQSRWFNAVACVASPDQVQSLRELPFVALIQPMCVAFDEVVEEGPVIEFTDDYETEILNRQTESMQYSILRKAGYTGKGVRIAIFDAGFKGLLEDEAFQHLIAQNRIRATYDFVRDKKFVFGHHTHGTNVLSCVSGIKNGIPIGCATDAEFVLARTEQTYKESQMEEENWVESLEWADKTGADIVNSSLGYTRQFYFTQDMDGRRSLISRAASMAARKGILVFSSAGNEGDKKWEVITSPADADSILTIGAIDPWTGYHADFSSYGPTADNRLKPNLCAFGYAITADHNRLALNSGTSFSSPLIAGFAACIKQMHPDWRLSKVMDELQKSGTLYPYYDYAHGYGIPQANYFISTDTVEFVDTGRVQFVHEPEMDRIRITVLRDSTESSPSTIMSNDVINFNPEPLMYIHIARPDNTLISYEMTSPGETTGGFVSDAFDPQCTLRVHWRGITYEKKIDEIVINKRE